MRIDKEREANEILEAANAPWAFHTYRTQRNYAVEYALQFVKDKNMTSEGFLKLIKDLNNFLTEENQTQSK